VNRKDAAENTRAPEEAAVSSPDDPIPYDEWKRQQAERGKRPQPEPPPKKKRRGRKSLGVLRQRNGWFHIDIQHENLRVRRAAKTKDREVATALLVKMLNDIQGGRFGEVAPRPLSFNDLVELLKSDYKRRRLRSWDRSERSIAHLRKTFGTLPAAAITRKKVADYMAKREVDGAEAGTIRAECAYLKRMLRLACADGALRSMPVFPTLPTSPARQGFFTEDEVLRIVPLLPPPVNDLVLTLWITGWRRREIQFLKWADVDVQAGEIRLTEDRSKTSEPRLFPFSASASLAKTIKARYLARGAGSVYVFERSPGSPIKDFRGAWSKACKQAGLDKRMPHDFRRSRARHLSRIGVPDKVIMDLCGWKTRAMFDRYNITSRRDLVEALERAEKSKNVTIASQNDESASEGSSGRSA
jgi:integrase